MVHSLLGLSSLSLAVAVVMTFIPSGSRAIGVLALLGVGVFVVSYLFRCRHASPGLLPPITNTDGSRVSARWCCHECGKTWPATFEHDTRPIQKYSGYDESKAIAAARRADQLSRQQRGLAVRRAGTARRPRPVSPLASADVVAITRGHRMAK